MKYVLIIPVMFLIGCTGESDQIESLQRLQRSTQENLQTCQQQLDFYRQSGGSLNQNTDPNDSYNSEPEKPAEPEYEEVDVYEVDGTKCYATDDMDNAAPACGRSFWKCNDKVLRECMTNVKYKISKERKLVEQEE
jgi:hypothetical protein